MMKVSVSIDVSDIKLGEKFYIEALECKKKKDQGGMVILGTENIDIYLQEKKDGSDSTELIDVKSERSYARHWTPIHLDFLTKDIENVTKNITRLGGTYEGGDSWDGGSIAHFSDPFGNGFCVIDE